MFWLLLILLPLCFCAGRWAGASAGAQARREDKARYRRACERLAAETAARIRLAGDVAELAAHAWEAERRQQEQPGVN